MFRAMMIPFTGSVWMCGLPSGVDVALGAAERGRHLQQVDAGVGGDVAGAALGDLPVAGAVEQRRHPELEVEAGGDEQVGVAQHGHEAGLGLDEVGILVALGDRGDGALVADDLAGDGAVGREAGDDLERRPPGRGGGRATVGKGRERAVR